jgi:hypothetical protein
LFKNATDLAYRAYGPGAFLNARKKCFRDQQFACNAIRIADCRSDRGFI